MTKIKVAQTYNISINPNIYTFGNSFTLNNNDDWFKLQLQKIHADSLSIKTLDDGYVNGAIKATVYLTVTPDSRYDLDELVSGKVSFTLDLGKVKISNLNGCFEVETNDNTEINFDLNFNPRFSQKDKDFFIKSIAGIIRREDFKVNIEQTVSKIDFIEK